MDRLTNHFDYCKMIDCKFYDPELRKQDKCKFFDIGIEHCHEKRLNDKLREYEDLEEQGLLLKLPCKIGTKVHYISDVRCKYYLSKDCFNCTGHEFANDCYEPIQTIEEYVFVVEMFEIFGRTVFLTKEEAEAALERMGE